MKRIKMSQELPSDVTRIIREFSMPLTRPDWKRGCAICHASPKLWMQVRVHVMRRLSDIYIEEYRRIAMQMITALGNQGFNTTDVGATGLNTTYLTWLFSRRRMLNYVDVERSHRTLSFCVRGCMRKSFGKHGDPVMKVCLQIMDSALLGMEEVLAPFISITDTILAVGWRLYCMN
jgi:hypothetical protein